MNHPALPSQPTRRIVSSSCALALAAASMLSPAYAARVVPPDVVPELRVLDGSHAFLVGHAIGTQNYVCVTSAASAAGVAYVLFTPEATLFNDDGDQLITHFFSPDEDPSDPNTSGSVVAEGAVRPTWQHSRDGSAVWARLHPNGSVPVNGAVPLLLLDKVGVADGLTGGGILSKTSQIQRLNTTGGVAPAQGCSSPADIGHTAFVPYTADYYFYTKE